MPLYIPENYTNILGTVQNTEKAVKSVKDMFQEPFRPACPSEGHRSDGGPLGNGNQ